MPLPRVLAKDEVADNDGVCLEVAVRIDEVKLLDVVSLEDNSDLKNPVYANENKNIYEQQQQQQHMNMQNR